jgi:uncharacterized SAM-binding protein YcdF (DUF218 family)
VISLLSALAVPSGLATMLFLTGVAFALVPRSRKYSLPLAAAAAFLLLVFGNGVVATLLMSPLEYAYPALQEPQRHPDVHTIVVLTGWAADDDDFPLSAKMNAASAFRVLEAANLHAARPDCRVLVTGSDTAARVMARQLRALGVPDEDLVVDVMSNDTAESARQARRLLGPAPVFLVTSAGHMRRAAWSFEQQGLLPVAAPTDHLMPRSIRQASWTTSALHLQASDLALHEYLGLAWYRLREFR